MKEMTPEEVIKLLKGMQNKKIDYAIEEAIKALNEIQQYREIGTVEECQEAREKQIPKKCNVAKDNFRIYYSCPKCNHNLRIEYNRGSWIGKRSKYCSCCGQDIQWDENLEETENEQD